MSGIVVQMKIDGLDTVLKRLKALPVEIGAKGGGPLRRALRAGSYVIRNTAVRMAPRGRGTPHPGRLKRALRVSIHRRPQQLGGTEVFKVGVYQGRKNTRKGIAIARDDPRGAQYWWYVENGTSKMRARPFLRPAFEASKAQALQVIIAHMEKGLKAAEQRAKKLK